MHLPNLWHLLDPSDPCCSVFGAAGLVGAVAAIRKVICIMGILRDLMALFIVIIGVVTGEEAPGGGAEKRAAAIAKTRSILAAPGGIDLPGWINPHLDLILGVFVDAAVALLNRSGFFGRGAPSNAPSPKP